MHIQFLKQFQNCATISTNCKQFHQIVQPAGLCRRQTGPGLAETDSSPFSEGTFKSSVKTPKSKRGAAMMPAGRQDRELELWMSVTTITSPLSAGHSWARADPSFGEGTGRPGPPSLQGWVLMGAVRLRCRRPPVGGRGRPQVWGAARAAV